MMRRKKKKKKVIYLNMILANGMILCQQKTGNCICNCIANVV